MDADPIRSQAPPRPQFIPPQQQPPQQQHPQQQPQQHQQQPPPQQPQQLPGGVIPPRPNLPPANLGDPRPPVPPNQGAQSFGPPQPPQPHNPGGPPPARPQLRRRESRVGLAAFGGVAPQPGQQGPRPGGPPPQQGPPGQPGQQPLYQQFAPQQISKQPIGPGGQPGQPPQGQLRPQINPNQQPNQFNPNQRGPPPQNIRPQFPPQQQQPQHFQQQQQNRPQLNQFARPQQPNQQQPQQFNSQNPGQFRQPFNPNQNPQIRPQNNQQNPIRPQLQNPLEKDRIMSSEAAMVLNKPIDMPSLKSTLSKDDDDDDVILGRATTPRQAGEHNDTKNGGMNGSDMTRSVISPLQRNDSQKSIPSRPQSSMGQTPSDIIKQNTFDRKPNALDRQKSPSPEQNALKTDGLPDNITSFTAIGRQKLPATTASNVPPSQTKPVSLNTIIGGSSNPTPKSGNTKSGERVLSASKDGEKVAERVISPTQKVGGKGDSKSRPQSARNKKKGDNDSGVDESTQGNDKNGSRSPGSPLKSPSKIPGPRPPSAAANKSRSSSKTRSLISPDTPEEPIKKKVPMNKIQVGNTPSPNLKVVRSKIGSLDNATHKPGGGNVKIETKKLDIKATPRIEAKNEHYAPKGSDKKIISNKLQWNAKSKIGSLENAAHKPGGGDKKIETLKTDFTKAKPKVGSKDNMKYIPGGGEVKEIPKDEGRPKSRSKIQTHKVDIKAQSKIGSLDNVKHKPGGGDIKIFDDKEYLKNVEHPIPITPPSQLWRSSMTTSLTTSMSLPAECIVLSLTTPSTPSKSRAAFIRMNSCGAKTGRDGRAFHPRPFRNF